MMMFHQNLLWFSSLCLVYWSYEQVAYPYGRRPFFDSRRLHWIMMLSLHVIMSSCHLVNHFIVSSFMSSSHRVIILSCHHFIMSSCHHLCHHCIMSSCHRVIMSSFYHLCHHSIMSSCQLLASFGSFWQLMLTIGNFWQLLTIFCNI